MRRTVEVRRPALKTIDMLKVVAEINYMVREHLPEFIGVAPVDLERVSDVVPGEIAYRFTFDTPAP